MHRFVVGLTACGHSIDELSLGFLSITFHLGAVETDVSPLKSALRPLPVPPDALGKARAHPDS